MTVDDIRFLLKKKQTEKLVLEREIEEATNKLEEMRGFIDKNNEELKLAEENNQISRTLFKYNLENLTERGHLWGCEQWIVNNKSYCAKVLTVNPGYTSSLHMHNHKTETFIGLDGVINLDYYSNGIRHGIQIRVGDIITIPIETLHQFSGDGSILEVSTPDTDDNVKVRPASEISNNFDASLGGGK